MVKCVVLVTVGPYNYRLHLQEIVILLVMDLTQPYAYTVKEIVILLVMDLTQPYAYTVTGNRDIVGYGSNTTLCLHCYRKS